jgi:hypothetical protein
VIKRGRLFPEIDINDVSEQQIGYSPDVVHHDTDHEVPEVRQMDSSYTVDSETNLGSLNYIVIYIW